MIQTKDDPNEPPLEPLGPNDFLHELVVNRVERLFGVDLEFVEGAFGGDGLVVVIGEGDYVVVPGATGDETFLTVVDDSLARGSDDPRKDRGN